MKWEEEERTDEQSKRATMAPGEFRVLDAQYVQITPPPEYFKDKEEDNCSVLPLTFFDVKWLHLPPVERVFLYRLCLPEENDKEKILSGLRESLQQSHAFFPLAGKVRLAPGRTDRHELVYQPGDGVHFTTAEYDVDVDELLGDTVRVSALSPLVPPLPRGRAVLAVQATLLRRSGVAVGVTIHHTACDGRGSTHFLHTWASRCRAPGTGTPPSSPPVTDRTLVPDPRGLYDTYLKGMPPIVRSQDLEFIASKQAPADDVAIATFVLSEEELQSVRSAVADEAARRGRRLSPRCSPLVAAYGLMWWCHCNAHELVKQQNKSVNSEKKKDLYNFVFSVDQRSRMKPAIPDRYLGNCMCPAIAAVTRDEMITNTTTTASSIFGGLYAACSAVAAAIEEEVAVVAGDQQQWERWEGCVERVKNAVANGTLSVAGSPRFRVYDVDFGFGRPAKVHIVSVAKTGAVSVADSHAGRRGLELGISLPPDVMDSFRKCFADAMEHSRRLLLRK